MSEKDEILEHISAIKSHLVDKQSFYPYNYNATYVWSILAILLTFLMVPAYEEGIFFGTMLVLGLVTFGFISEGIMTKKVNKIYDIADCTLRQRFITKNFIMLSLFLIVLSATLAKYELYIPIYLSWLFLISIGYFAVGHVLNISRFTKMAQFNVLLSIVLLAVGGYQEHLVGTDSNCFIFVKAAVILGLAIFPAIIAWHQKKELALQNANEDED
ncbi:MAG: hypothetical protein GQ531_04825 [Sulfurovum sp.]|nr:hypothetical protein [Sulfurovum sp.]